MLQEHTKNTEGKYCYCGGGTTAARAATLYRCCGADACWPRMTLGVCSSADRTYTELTLQCEGCRNWFHAKCVRCPLGPVLPFISNYTVRALDSGAPHGPYACPR